MPYLNANAEVSNQKSNHQHMCSTCISIPTQNPLAQNSLLMYERYPPTDNTIPTNT